MFTVEYAIAPGGVAILIENSVLTVASDALASAKERLRQSEIAGTYLDKPPIVEIRVKDSSTGKVVAHWRRA